MAFSRKQDILLLAIPVILGALIAASWLTSTESRETGKEETEPQKSAPASPVLVQTTTSGVNVRVTEAIRDPSRSRITVVMASDAVTGNEHSLGKAVAQAGGETVRVVKSSSKAMPGEKGVAYEFRFHVDYPVGSSFATASHLGFTVDLGFAKDSPSTMRFRDIEISGGRAGRGIEATR